MDNIQWRRFFEIGAEVLGKGSEWEWETESWCAWTTFPKLKDQCSYWNGGFPNKSDLKEGSINEGSPWGQFFHYDQLAHIIIPASFYWERMQDKKFAHGTRTQNIKLFSEKLTEAGIPHRLTDLVLEIKLY